MRANEFVKAIRQNVITDDHTLYRNLLDNSDNASDTVWKSILPIYKNLTEDQKKSFLDFLRLVQVNTVSHIFGVLDGATYLDEKKESFELKPQLGDEIINGYLQDIFLEMEEGHL